MARDGCRAARKARQAAWPSGGTVVVGGLERVVAGREVVMVLGVRALALVVVVVSALVLALAPELALAEGEREAEAASGSGYGTRTGLR